MVFTATLALRCPVVARPSLRARPARLLTVAPRASLSDVGKYLSEAMSQIFTPQVGLCSRGARKLCAAGCAVLGCVSVGVGTVFISFCLGFTVDLTIMVTAQENNMPWKGSGTPFTGG